MRRIATSRVITNVMNNIAFRYFAKGLFIGESMSNHKFYSTVKQSITSMISAATKLKATASVKLQEPNKPYVCRNF
jgi:hypothetical protein